MINIPPNPTLRPLTGLPLLRSGHITSGYTLCRFAPRTLGTLPLATSYIRKTLAEILLGDTLMKKVINLYVLTIIREVLRWNTKTQTN